MSGAILPSNPSSSKGQRYALVVGANSAPHIPHLSLLKSAEEDALSVASALQEHCDCTLVCDPLLGINATASAVRQALKTLAVTRTDDDILLFYFAGHGFIHEDSSGQRQVYLATSDLDAHLIQEGEDIESISLDWLRERLYEKTKAGRVLLILDCCYAGNMGRIPGDLPLNTIFDLFKHYLGATNDVSLRKYRGTIAATGHDVEASEKNDHSMTNHLLAVLRGECHTVLNQEGEVTIGRLYDYLYQIMPAEQKPSFSGDTAGRGLVLATYPEYSAQALQAQQWAGQREERRERLQILSAAPDGERFLRDRLESFVGRETELHDIQQRIAIVQPSGGYVTITGQAGQGKSSIIAALIAQYASTSEKRERIPFHFIPFNPGPEYQVTLLRNLMARLILKYDLSDLYVASESRPALRDFFPKVLNDVATKGGQEIIFIDGLDQIESDLNEVRDLSFLPTNPPKGIVFVLGTRPDDTLKPLTLLKPTQSYLLPPLSREDFSILLQRRQVPHLEQRLADQFYEKMQQNALYLDLLAKELHDQGPITSDAIETIIQRLAEDPNNIFSLALEHLERRGDWHEVIKPLLGVFLVAYEPLTPWQLRTILKLDHRQIENGLQCLSGLIMHIEQRYALYHLKFLDFLHQDEARPDKPCIFATDEEAGYHTRLVQWCERDQLSIIWEDTKDTKEQSWRIYVRHHYISHLYAARQWERLFTVLDEQSYGQAKERYDIGGRSYVQDLKKGCLAAVRNNWTDEQHLKHLPYLWRYTLLHCSIRSTADQYPLELFKVMLVLGKEREVAGLIELITVLSQKVDVMLLLGRHLFQSSERKQEGAAVYMRAEEVIRSIENTTQQTKALIALASALVLAQEGEKAKRVFSQAEEVAYSIRDSDQRTKALIALTSALAQAQEWKQAEEVAYSIDDVSYQAAALTTLASALAQAGEGEKAKRVFSYIEKVVHSIEDSYQQVIALTTLASALAQAGEGEKAKRVFSYIEKVVHSIEDSYQQGWALNALTSALAQAQEWKQAEEVAYSIESSYQQVRVLTTLANILTQAQEGEKAQHVFTQAEKIAYSIEDSDQQGWALTPLAIALTQAQEWKQAEKVTRSIEDPDQQAKALTALAVALAQAQEWERARSVFSQAERVVSSIKDSGQQAKALTALAIALTQAQEWEQAEKIVRSIQDTDQQAKALNALAIILAQAQEWEQAEKIVRSIQDSGQQAKALTALAIALTQAQEWEQAEKIVRSIQDTDQQAEALIVLTTVLAQAHQWQSAEEFARSIQDVFRQARSLNVLVAALAQAQEWKQAEKVAHSIEDASQRAAALTTLFTVLAQTQKWELAKRVFSQAEKCVRSIRASYQQAAALTALVTALAQAQEWKRAEEIARSIEVSYQQSGALTVLASVLAQAQEWKQAEEIARSIEDADQQARALNALVVALAQAQEWKQAEEIARSIEVSYQQAAALTALVAALAQAQEWKQAEEIARSIERLNQQAEALAILATAFTQAEEWKQAEEIARSIEDANQQAKALSALAAALTQAQKWKQAEEVASSIEDAYQQAETLAALSTALAQIQEEEKAKRVFLQAEKIAHSIRASDQQAQAFIALITALTEQGQYSRLLSFVQRSWERVETREEALRQFSLVSGLIIHTPVLGMELFEAFQWVNIFLSGSS